MHCAKFSDGNCSFTGTDTIALALIISEFSRPDLSGPKANPTLCPLDILLKASFIASLGEYTGFIKSLGLAVVAKTKCWSAVASAKVEKINASSNNRPAPLAMATAF